MQEEMVTVGGNARFTVCFTAHRKEAFYYPVSWKLMFPSITGTFLSGVEGGSGGKNGWDSLKVIRKRQGEVALSGIINVPASDCPWGTLAGQKYDAPEAADNDYVLSRPPDRPKNDYPRRSKEQKIAFVICL